MKTLKYLVISLLAMAAASCAKEAYVEDASPKFKITFNVLNENTKSFLDPSKAVKWSEGDAVNIYDDIAGKLDASFAISSDKITAEVSAGATKFFSLYPYDNASLFAEDKITTTLPALQEATVGSFANGANLAVAYTEVSNPSLTYANVGTLVKFTLDEEDVQSVKFLGRSGEAVAGKIKIDYNGGNPTYELVSAATEVELANSDKSALTKGATYYFVVLPQAFANGISLILTKADGSFATKSSNASVTFARNEITNLGSISGLTFGKDKHALYQAGQALSIGGVKFSRAVNGDAVIVKSSENAANIITAISGNPGVYFLDDDANSGFNMEAGKTLVSTGNTALFSRYADARVNLTPALKSVISITDGNFAVSGVEFDLSVIGAKLSQNTKATGDIDNIVFEDCSFKTLGYPIINSTNETHYGMSNITFNKCKFFPVSSVYFVSYNTSTVLYKLQNFTFTNSVVCATAPMQIGSLIYYKDSGVDYSSVEYSTVTWNTKVNACYNIFYNVLAKNGCIHLYSVKQEVDACIMKHDVFAVSETTTLQGTCFALYDKGINMTNASGFVRVREGIRNTTDIPNLKPSTNNAAYYGTSSDFLKFNQMPSHPASEVFTTAEPATGTFVMNSSYSTLGPQ